MGGEFRTSMRTEAKLRIPYSAAALLHGPVRGSADTRFATHASPVRTAAPGGQFPSGVSSHRRATPERNPRPSPALSSTHNEPSGFATPIHAILYP
jgi:hypothetical protein